MTPAQENQLVLEHKFLAQVKYCLDQEESGSLEEHAAGLVLRDLWEHWVGVMCEYKDDEAKKSFMHELDEVIGLLKGFRRKFS